MGFYVVHVTLPQYLAKLNEMDSSLEKGKAGGRMNHIVLWKWKQPNFKQVYTAEHVNVMRRYASPEHARDERRLICVTDDPTGVDKDGYVPALERLHGPAEPERHQPSIVLPSPEALRCHDAKEHGHPGRRADRLGRHRHGRGRRHAAALSKTRNTLLVGRFVAPTIIRVFNGSMFMFTAREHQEIWSRFDPKVTPDRCHKAGYLGSDQSWLSL
jgi:hypothetical protein